MAQSKEQYAKDLSSVHAFYLYLLESALGHEVPVPPSIAHDTDVLERFVSLLDMAVAPQMIRDGLKSETQFAYGESLLRFFASKSKRRREDRDKVDVIATALYRFRFPQSEAETADDTENTTAFEQYLRKLLQDIPLGDPAPEHVQLVREFQFLRDEVNDFRHFDELIDSGVIQKVRDIKETLAASFLNPSVVAPIASYNLFFGHRFDSLFKRAAKEVKTFAAKVQQDGGSIMSRVDGDVIVKQLADVDEGKILNEEYGRAQEDLRHVSKLKKAVDNRRFGKTAVAPKAPQQPGPGRLGGGITGGSPPLMSLSEPISGAPAPARASVPLGPAGAHAARAAGADAQGYAVPRSASGVGDVEVERMQALQTTIRNFVRAADPASANVVPLPNGNITLTNAEVEAFRADHGSEKSFRADFASTLMRLAAVEARLQTELLEFERTRYTEYNWKPHADAMAHLLTLGRSAAEFATQLQTTAQQRGLTEKAAALHESVEKARVRARAAADALQSIG